MDSRDAGVCWAALDLEYAREDANREAGRVVESLPRQQATSLIRESRSSMRAIRDWMEDEVVIEETTSRGWVGGDGYSRSRKLRPMPKYRPQVPTEEDRPALPEPPAVPNSMNVCCGACGHFSPINPDERWAIMHKLNRFTCRCGERKAFIRIGLRRWSPIVRKRQP